MYLIYLQFRLQTSVLISEKFLHIFLKWDLDKKKRRIIFKNYKNKGSAQNNLII